MSKPSLNKLRAFDAAGEHLNFRLAAEALNLTQGAVAQQVRALEEELGLPLFDRLPRGLRLTDAGAHYHAAVAQALAIIDRATENLKPGVPRVTISLPPSLASKWLVPRLPRFQDLHPDIEIATVATERLANFKTDDIDLAIRIGTPPFKALQHRHLSAMRLCAVCSPGYGATIDPIENLSNLKDIRLLQDGHDTWEAALGESRIANGIRILKFNHSGLAIDAALDGQGIALVPEILVSEEIRRKRLVVVPMTEALPASDKSYHLVFPQAAQRHAPAREAVIDWIVSEFQSGVSSVA
ncbi:LysR substrate-binding domain-containing protein [Roseibium sp.]|uniref:LysR substrate-binding domain-containing protein n=2 Tax=Roseibium sp. TaxID=1936156 RepID=UPI003266D974